MVKMCIYEVERLEVCFMVCVNQVIFKHFTIFQDNI